MIVYKIINSINGKIYIGQTIMSLNKRWRLHCQTNSSCHLLCRAIRKYGRENFTIEQIDHAHTREELDNKEIFWIKFYDSMNPNKGYNLTSGGLHCEVSDETKNKISKSLKGKISPMKGKRLTNEWIENIRKSQSGENHPWWGRHHSEETKRKISETKKGCVSMLVGEKHPNFGKPSPMRGKKMSEESKLKMRGKRPSLTGKNHPQAKKVRCVETGEIFDCAAIISVELGFNKNSVGYVCRSKNRTLGGYHWEYVK